MSAMKKKQVLLMMNARKFLSVIVQYAAQHNWRLTLMNDGIAPRGWKGDGAIVSFSRSESQMRFIAKFAQTSTPVVGLSYARPDIKIPRAVVDYSQNARVAAEHLHSKGYRHFVFCTSERIKSAEISYKVFVEHLRMLGVADDIPWIVRAETIRKGREDDWDENMRAFKKIHKLPKPLGIWCMSDSVAVNVLDCAIANGISVPAEVGILGTNDNIIVCENQDITISSINPNFRNLAITACEMLDKMMESGEKENAFTYIPALGVSERESTAGAYEKSPLLKDILRFMSDNISSSITVEEIAAKFSVSVSKLHRLFRDEMKTTPLAELRSLRFNKAKSLLRTTDFTLDFIANATGFLHPPHLVNAFRSSVGLTPAEWRRLWK